MLSRHVLVLSLAGVVENFDVASPWARWKTALESLPRRGNWLLDGERALKASYRLTWTISHLI
jgi:hypothetical protein